MRQFIRISDPGDTRIAAYRDIRERDLVGRQNRFVAEGKVVLRVLADQERFACESVLVLEKKLPGLEPILESLPPNTAVHIATQDVIDKIAGFHLHRGILAIGRHNAPEEPSAILGQLPQRAVVLLLSGISNHDNIGGIFRNAAAFDAAAVMLDRQCSDPLYRKAIRVSVGAVLKVPFCRVESVRQAIGLLSQNSFETWSLSPAGKCSIASCAFSARTAFILGTEGEGLSQEILETTNSLQIPISGGFDSLNVATASAIALHRFHESIPV